MNNTNITIEYDFGYDTFTFYCKCKKLKASIYPCQICDVPEANKIHFPCCDTLVDYTFIINTIIPKYNELKQIRLNNIQKENTTFISKVNELILSSGDKE